MLDDVGTVIGSETRLLQVFLNLLMNAIDALSSLPPDRPRHIRVRLERRGDDAVVSVSDSGLGVPKEARAHIFEPFFSTKPRGQGTGLGLAVAKTIIEGLHGSIALVDGATDTTFEVRIPQGTDPSRR
jgi:signal transduction histidine kinase